MNRKDLLLIGVFTLTMIVSNESSGTYVVPEADMDFTPYCYFEDCDLYVLRKYYPDPNNRLKMNASCFGSTTYPSLPGFAAGTRSNDPDTYPDTWVPGWVDDWDGIVSWRWKLYSFDPIGLVKDYLEYTSESGNPAGWPDHRLDGYHEFTITSPDYYILTLTVSDSDWYDSDGAEENHTDAAGYILIVFDLAIVGDPYIQLNNDDDNENGIMDWRDTTNIPQENDLKGVCLYFSPYPCDGEVELKLVSEDFGSVYVWNDQTRISKILPRDGVPSYEKWYVRWGIPTTQPKIVWAEGKGSAQQTAFAWSYVVDGYKYPVYGTENYVPVILEVDMDIDSVKDSDQEKPMFPPEITEETTPGAFIHLDDTVKIDCLNILPANESLVPVDGGHTVILYPKIGGNKIKLWRNPQKTQELGFPQVYSTRSQMNQEVANGLYIEGEELSNAPRDDIKLALKWGNNYEDEVNITVVDLPEICLYSGNALSSPVCYQGGQYELGNPCLASGAEPSLIIPHCNVRNPSDPSVIVDHSIDLWAIFLPTLDNSELPIEKRDLDKWSKVAGPDSGYLHDAKELVLFTEYRNPQKGGVYEIEFEIPGWDWTRTHGLIHLPLAGPDATNWTLTQKMKVSSLGTDLMIWEEEYGGVAVPMLFDSKVFAFVSAQFDWKNPATQSGRSPCRVFGTNETLTIGGVVVDRGQFNDMMWGVLARRCYGVSYTSAKAFAVSLSMVGLGTPDGVEAVAAYDAGKNLEDGVPIQTVMQTYGYTMQHPNGLASKCWPSEDPYIGGVAECPYINMSYWEVRAELKTWIRQNYGSIVSTLF